MLFFIIIAVSIIFGIASFTHTAVTALRILNTGVSLTNSYNITRDIPYGSEPWQKLDIYRAQDSDENTPVIVFLEEVGLGAIKHILNLSRTVS